MPERVRIKCKSLKETYLLEYYPLPSWNFRFHALFDPGIQFVCKHALNSPSIRNENSIRIHANAPLTLRLFLNDEILRCARASPVSRADIFCAIIRENNLGWPGRGSPGSLRRVRSEVVARLARFKVIIWEKVSPVKGHLGKVGWLAYYMITETFYGLLQN